MESRFSVLPFLTWKHHPVLLDAGTSCISSWSRSAASWFGLFGPTSMALELLVSRISDIFLICGTVSAGKLSGRGKLLVIKVNLSWLDFNNYDKKEMINVSVISLSQFEQEKLLFIQVSIKITNFTFKRLFLLTPFYSPNNKLTLNFPSLLSFNLKRQFQKKRRRASFWS